VLLRGGQQVLVHLGHVSCGEPVEGLLQVGDVGPFDLLPTPNAALWLAEPSASSRS
jgi:hypothetical protein